MAPNSDVEFERCRILPSLFLPSFHCVIKQSDTGMSLVFRRPTEFLRVKNQSMQKIRTSGGAGQGPADVQLPMAGLRMDERCSHVSLDPTLPRLIIWDFRKSVEYADDRQAPLEQPQEETISAVSWLMRVTDCDDEAFATHKLSLATKRFNHLFFGDRKNMAYKCILSSEEMSECPSETGVVLGGEIGPGGYIT